MAGWLGRLFGRREAGPVWIEPVWVEAGELRDRLSRGEPPLILDVRGPDEFDGPLGHIDGARNVPLPELPRHLPQIGRESGSVIVVCLTDKRSSQAAASLAASGIRDVAVLRGGMRAWRGA
jgi:rhodanese-related sulfurtransferase